MKKYDLYLFDFDGTLMDTMSALEYIFSVAYEHVGMKFNPSLTVEFSRIPINIGYYRLGGKEENFKAFCDYLHDAIDFPESMRRTKPYHDSFEFIEYVRKNDIATGIVTSNKASHVKDVMNMLNIPLNTFQVYMGNQDYKKFKPHPDPILEALKAINYTGDLSRIAYIGDGMNDALCANAAGVDAILLDRFNEYQDSDKYIRIHGLMDLFK